MTDFMTYVHRQHPEESRSPCANPSGHRFPGTRAGQPCIYCGVKSEKDRPDNLDSLYREEPKGAWFINVYELGREYGGTEEGGWWFDTGGLVDTNRLVNVTETEAKDIARSIEDQLVAEARENEVPPVHSVMYRGGWFTVRAEQQPGADWPAERPHYE